MLDDQTQGPEYDHDARHSPDMWPACAEFRDLGAEVYSLE